MNVIGKIIGNRYEILKEVGNGGMATVYKAKDHVLNRNVAVKVLRGDLSNDEKFVRRFQREALNASSLSHPNIVEVYDVGEENGQHYIVMEYIEGKTLAEDVVIKNKVYAAAGDGVMEFGLRRAQGPDAGLYGARAAMIGGCIGTSNVLCGQLFDVPVKGTHAHSWIMSFPDEYTAFKTYADMYPSACILQERTKHIR